MKNSLRQKILIILCIAIVFIPTYIAITYFGVKSAELKGSRYSVKITAHNGENIEIDSNDLDSVAKSIIKMNSALKLTTGVDNNALPEKYYDIKVTDNGTVYDYRYYFSTDKTKSSLVMDRNNSFYYLDFKDAKAFLSRDCSYLFYENSSLPTLSIFGGDDVLPKSAEWEYKAVNGSFVHSPNIKSSAASNVYAMSGRTKLSFSIAPDKCTIRVYRNGKEILKTNDLNDIPYSELDSTSLSFVIHAEWTSSAQYKGSAEYEFSTAIGKAPKFYINSTTIESGEFFIITGTNVSAPQKIEFSSSPEIDFTPVFFTEGEYVYAFIPVDKSLPNPMEYTFTFKYGDAVSQINVNVSERSYDIKEQHYDCEGIDISRDQYISKYQELLQSIGQKSETIRYFGSDFINYEALSKYTIKLGFGHFRIPDNGDKSFRLDGVDYTIDISEAAGFDIPAISAGKVVYTGYDEILGNFVVLDHGFGLKTWYCHLSDIVATENSVITKGSTVGKAGSSGYTNSTGVYLITTIMDVPVCPYAIQEHGLILPTPDN